jgi:hypothetical protein
MHGIDGSADQYEPTAPTSAGPALNPTGIVRDKYVGQGPRTLRMAGLTTLVEKIRLTLAARRFAKRLGPRLRHDYGGGGEYSVGQIRTAMQRCRLPLRHITLAYAAFMSEETFRTVADPSDWPAYAALRALYFDWVPVRSFSQPDPPEAPHIRADGSWS